MIAITEITKKEIFCYHDYSFLIFNRSSLINGAEYVGVCWAGGKSGKANDPTVVPPEKIKRDTPYHHILLMRLIEIAEAKKGLT